MKKIKTISVLLFCIGSILGIIGVWNFMHTQSYDESVGGFSIANMVSKGTSWPLIAGILVGFGLIIYFLIKDVEENMSEMNQEIFSLQRELEKLKNRLQ